MKRWIRSHIRYTHLFIAVISMLFLLSAVRFVPQVAAEEKLVVGVAAWRCDGGAQQDVQELTYQRLLQGVLEKKLEHVEVIKIPAALNSARDVDEVARRFHVDVITWGWYDEIAVRGYVDLANATEENGMTNSLAQFLENGGNTEVIQVLKVLSDFDYYQDGVSFCVPRWTP